MNLKNLKYYKEFFNRNPELVTLEVSHSVKIEDVTNFIHEDTGLPLGSRVNFSYGKRNSQILTEDFPSLPNEWEVKEPEPVRQTRVGFREGHICAIPVNIELSRDEASRQRVLDQSNIKDWPRPIRSIIKLFN